MKKNGFTLVEMLAVIAVLGLLVSIIVPVVTNLLGDSEDALYQEQVNNVIVAAKQYMVLHSDLLPEQGSIASVTISELIDDGVIDNDKVIDPKTKDELSGCVVVNYNNDFNQYEYNYKNNCSITVTFDADGGSVSKSSMNVLYGKKYGDLPVPTRDGYTFMGWNGKNMLDPNNEYAMRYNGEIDRTKVTYDSNTGIYTSKGWQSSHHMHGYNVISEVTNNKTYTFSAKIEETGTENTAWIGFTFLANDTWKYNYSTPSIEAGKRIAYTLEKIPEGATTCIVGLINRNKGTGLRYSKLQLEEGNTATEWEPYYVTSDVKVTQKSNHTLKAIWKANS